MPATTEASNQKRPAGAPRPSPDVCPLSPGASTRHPFTMNDGQTQVRELVATFSSHLSTLALATAGAEGEPECSVAAAILDESGAFIVYVSGLAAHTRNLRANPRASVLLAEDEAEVSQPFARRRITFACSAHPLARESPEYAPLVAALRKKFGAAFDLIASLPDFQLVRLVPQRGRVVAGFGAAFDVDPRDWHRPDRLQLSAVGPRAR